MIDSETLVKSLKENICSVEFTKVNGEKRTMRCTLLDDLLPENETKKERKSNPEVLPVWDLDKEDWRSFRFDSVISFAVEETVA